MTVELSQIPSENWTFLSVDVIVWHVNYMHTLLLQTANRFISDGW